MSSPIDARYAVTADRKWHRFGTTRTYPIGELIPGVTLPTRENTGVVGAGAIPNQVFSGTPEGTTTVSFPVGTLIEDRIIYGDISPASGNGTVTLRRCIIYGGSHQPTSGQGAISAATTRTGTSRIVLEDCDIIVQTPSENRDAVRGNRITMKRCYVKGGVDGLVMYAFSNQNSGNISNYLEHVFVDGGLHFFYPEAAHTDGSHCDAMALNGGGGTASSVEASNTGFYAKGLRLNADIEPQQAQSYPPTETWQSGNAYYASGAGILLTNTVSIAPTSASHIIDGLWTEGGKSHINVKINVAITVNNYHPMYRTAYLQDFSTGYWIRYDAGVSPGVISGLSTSSWYDGPRTGLPVAVGANLGQHYN